MITKFQMVFYFKCNFFFIDFDLGLYGQLGVGTNCKQTLPMFVETLKNEKIYLICCGSFETVSKSLYNNIVCFAVFIIKSQYHNM